MFESAELGHRVDKAVYAREVPALREALLNAQYDLLQQGGFQVLLLIHGIEGGGKGEVVNLLNEWMDPRHIQTHGFSMPRPDELELPDLWRFWQALPPKGKIGIYVGSWYTAPIINRALKTSRKADLDQSLQQIVRLERMLVDEGVLLLKVWLHLSKAQQKTRLKALRKHPESRGRVTRHDLEFFKLYDPFRAVAQHTLRTTSTGEAPWTVVEGADGHYRNLMVAKTLLAALRERLDAPRARPAGERGAALLAPVDARTVIRSLDYRRKLPRDRYTAERRHWQNRLAELSRGKAFQKRAVAMVFEGNDAAGKGSSIRRVTRALDARIYSVVPIAAPTDEEKARPYLWRFWRHMPRRGRVVIFDRSWYGRVLVERVEGLCTEADWLRAYSEINDFEHQLAEHGIVLVKFWLAITKDEQLERFREREKTPFKRFKITPEDWRNRKKWGAYEQAVCDMVDRTSTDAAPWTLVAANDKLHARVQVLRTLVEAIERAR
ncbi:MAG TPA: polyphosphate:AMP phosphotransferase [Pelomicrobium sp.]|nr:polyphosphate:AMP phosphotransferase [Pelomicrobium sp.]